MFLRCPFSIFFKCQFSTSLPTSACCLEVRTENLDWHHTKHSKRVISVWSKNYFNSRELIIMSNTLYCNWETLHLSYANWRIIFLERRHLSSFRPGESLININDLYWLLMQKCTKQYNIKVIRGQTFLPNTLKDKHWIEQMCCGLQFI